MRVYLVFLLVLSGYSAGYAQQSCSDLFSARDYLHVEYGTEYTQHSENRFFVGVLGTSYEFEGVLSRTGRLTLYAYLTSPETGLRSHLNGPELFQRVIEHFGAERIRVISGYWTSGTNYSKYYEGMKAGLTPKEAAAQTWTGKQAARFGFTKVRSVTEKYDVTLDSVSVFADFVREPKR